MATRSSYQWTLDNYGKPCQSGGRVDVEWYPGQTDSLLPELVNLYRALGAVFLAYNYKVRDIDTGSYNCRQITGGTRPSPHSWPIAVDVNWKTNRYIKTPTLRKIRWGVETDMPAAMVTEAKRITAGGIVAFRWGGDWRTIKDPMHWEVRVTPKEIAGGIDAPRGLYGDDMAYLSDDAQKFWEEVFLSLGSPKPDAEKTPPIEPHSNEDFAKVLVEDFRARKAAGQSGKHSHEATITIGDPK